MDLKLICKSFLLLMTFLSATILCQPQKSLLELCNESDEIVVAEITIYSETKLLFWQKEYIKQVLIHSNLTVEIFQAEYIFIPCEQKGYARAERCCWLNSIPQFL